MQFEDFLRENDILLRIVSLPSHVRGIATYNGWHYLVLINSKCSLYQQRDSMIHELIHILNNHFYYPKGYAEKCEQEVKYIIKEMKENYINY